MAQLQNDPVGESIRKDKIIIQLGFEEYQYLGDSLRATQLNLRVRSYLRTLASLVMHAKEECYLQRGYSFETEDFFTRDHLRFIEIAIEKLNAETKSVHKKKAYGCVLKKSAEAIRSLYLSNGEDDKALEVSKFETCLNSRWKYIFRAAEVVAQRRRMECSRRPANLPCIEDLQTVRKHLEDKRGLFLRCKKLKSSHYIDIRRIVVCRLMLFNSRRANEVSSMKISEVKNAISNSWLSKDDISDDYFIGYLQGKNPMKPVSVIIPNNLKPLLQFLINDDVRKEASVYKSNKLAFPSTNSNLAVSGYHEFRILCLELNITVASSKVRHFMSTIKEKYFPNTENGELWVEHMGHSKEINKNVYQTPRAAQTVKQVGFILGEIDRALLSKSLPEKGSKDKAQFTDSSISIRNIKEAADTSNIAAAISKGSCEDDSFCSEATEEEHHNRSDACNKETHINSLRSTQNSKENCHSGDDELGLDLSHDSPTSDIFKSNQNYSEIDEESNNPLDFIPQEFKTPVKAEKKSVSQQQFNTPTCSSPQKFEQEQFNTPTCSSPQKFEQEQFNTPTCSSPQKFETPVKDDASLQKQESCITQCRPTPRLKSGRRRVEWHTDDTNMIKKFFRDKRPIKMNLEEFIERYDSKTLTGFTSKNSVTFLRQSSKY